MSENVLAKAVVTIVILIGFLVWRTSEQQCTQLYQLPDRPLSQPEIDLGFECAAEGGTGP
jgi:hypothetical protein